MTDRVAVILGSSIEVADVAGAAGWDVATGWRDLAVPAVDAPGETPRAAATIEVYETPEVVWLPRHGRRSGSVAHLVDHAANLVGLALAGCDRVIGVGSCGSLRADWPVGTVAVPDDLFAPSSTRSRFTGAEGHRVPGFDMAWRRRVVDGWRATSATPLVDAGTYVETPGPRFETRAEVRFYATVGDLVGMTIASECFLAGELDIPYAAVCVVDNLGNGIGGAPLSLDDYRAAVVANRARLAGDLVALAGALSS